MGAATKNVDDAAEAIATVAAVDRLADQGARALEAKPRRFGELRREVEGISEKVLTQQLREFERDGIVERTVHEQVPPKVVYSLTPLGAALNEALQPLGAWGEANMAHIVASRGGGPGVEEPERLT